MPENWLALGTPARGGIPSGLVHNRVARRVNYVKRIFKSKIYKMMKNNANNVISRHDSVSDLTKGKLLSATRGLDATRVARAKRSAMCLSSILAYCYITLCSAFELIIPFILQTLLASVLYVCAQLSFPAAPLAILLLLMWRKSRKLAKVCDPNVVIARRILVGTHLKKYGMLSYTNLVINAIDWSAIFVSVVFPWFTLQGLRSKFVSYPFRRVFRWTVYCSSSFKMSLLYCGPLWATSSAYSAAMRLVCQEKGISPKTLHMPFRSAVVVKMFFELHRLLGSSMKESIILAIADLTLKHRINAMVYKIHLDQWVQCTLFGWNVSSACRDELLQEFETKEQFLKNSAAKFQDFLLEHQIGETPSTNDWMLAAYVCLSSCLLVSYMFIYSSYIVHILVGGFFLFGTFCMGSNFFAVSTDATLRCWLSIKQKAGLCATESVDGISANIRRWLNDTVDSLISRVGAVGKRSRDLLVRVVLFSICVYAVYRLCDIRIIEAVLVVAGAYGLKSVFDQMSSDTLEHQSDTTVSLATLATTAILGYDSSLRKPEKLLRLFNELPRTASSFEALLPSVVNAFEFLVNWLCEMFGKEPKYYAARAYDDIDVFGKRITELRNEHNFLQKPWTQEGFEEILTMVTGLEMLTRKYARPEYAPARKHIDRLQIMLATLRKDAESSNAVNAGIRPEPVTIVLCGPPGVGKSKMVWPFMSHLYAATRPDQTEESLREALKNITHDVYVKNSADEFDDAYHGQFATVMDDAFQQRDSVGNPNPDNMFLIRAKNDMPYSLNMAVLEKKGKTFFTSRLMMLTTNVCNTNIESISDKGAIFRRHDYHIHMSVRQEFANANGGVDPSKVASSFDPDIWQFRLCKYNAKDPRVFVQTETMHSFHSLADEVLQLLNKRANLRTDFNDRVVESALQYAAMQRDGVAHALPEPLPPVPEPVFEVVEPKSFSTHGIFPRGWRTDYNLPDLDNRLSYCKAEAEVQLRPLARRHNNTRLAQLEVIYNKRIGANYIQAYDQPSLVAQVEQLELHRRTQISVTLKLEHQMLTEVLQKVSSVFDPFQKYYDYAAHQTIKVKLAALAVVLTALVLSYKLYSYLTSPRQEEPDQFEHQIGDHCANIYKAVSKNVVQAWYSGKCVGLGLALKENLIIAPTHFSTVPFKWNFMGVFYDTKILRPLNAELALFTIERRNNFPDISKHVHFGQFHGSFPDVLYCDPRLQPSPVLQTRAKRIKNFSALYGSCDVLEYAIPTKKGDCGSFLMFATGPHTGKVCGMHVIGKVSAGIGYAALFPDKPDLSPIALQHESSITENPVVHKVIGKAPDGPVFSSPVSRLRKTPLYGLFGESIYAKAALGNVQIGSETKHVHDIAVAKYARPRVEYSEATQSQLRHCSDAFLAHHLKVSDNIVRRKEIEPFETAVSGENFPSLSALPRTTAAGYPWCKHYSDGKKAFFGFGSDYSFDSPACATLKLAVEKRVQQAEQEGSFDPFIYQDSMKDEPRPHEKVLSGSTRLVSVAPVDCSVLSRMYYGHFIDSFFASKLRNCSAIGTNVYKDWDTIATRLLKSGGEDRIIAGDYSAFDASHSRVMISMAFRVMDTWYGNFSQAEKNVRDSIQADLAGSRHVWGDTVTEWDGSLPSGHPLTSVVNTIIGIVASSWAFASAYVDAGKGSFEDGVCAFYLELAHFQYGDDDISGVPLHYNFFTTDVKSKHLKRLGYTYTDDTKSLGVVGFKKLGEIKFLQRYFKYDSSERRHLAALELTSAIQKPLYFVMQGPHMKDITYGNIERVLVELSMHGPEVYHRYAPALRDAAADYAVVPRYGSYEDCLKAALASDDNWWLHTQGSIL